MNRLLANGLYQYLLCLADLLRENGDTTLSEDVLFASRFSSGSTTELYAESQKVLTNVLEHKDLLAPKEQERLKEIIAGIKLEFKRIGGA